MIAITHDVALPGTVSEDMPRIASLALLVLLAAELHADRVVTLHQPLGRRSDPTVTLLPDGRALVIGGSQTKTTFDLFDPVTSTFTPSAAQTPLPLLDHTATLLPDGRVLIAGGGYRTDGRPGMGNFGDDKLQLYDPVADELRAAGTMSDWRQGHTATLLGDGTVLIAGGANVDVGGFHIWRTTYRSAEIFDPVTGTIAAAGPMHARRSGHTATLLHDGRVLFFGGIPTGEAAPPPEPVAEIYDPATRSFTPVATDTHNRSGHTAALLPDGHVLLAGMLLFDPNSGATRSTVLPFRGTHTVTPLRDGTLLLFGGGVTNVVYDPIRDVVVSDSRRWR
ncbi:MAG TPA: kelch repeat-containing protein, partial [Thermoanaerobaculia bacterium]